MDGFLTGALGGLAANLTAQFVAAKYPEIFDPGLKRIRDEAEHYPQEAQERIVVNVNNYITALDGEVRERESSGEFDSDKASDNLRLPNVQRIATDGAVFAAMNNDLLLIESLVTLVVAALQADEGSQLAQVTMLSARTLERLRPANLRELAVIAGIKSYRPTEAALACDDREQQLEMIDADLKLFVDAFRHVAIDHVDALLLEESGAVNFRLSLGGFSNPRFEARNTQYSEIFHQPGVDLGRYPSLSWFLSRTQPVGFGRPPYNAPHFELTLSGWALGYVTLAKATGDKIELQRMLGLT